MRKIGIVEDDEKLSGELKLFLENNGYFAEVVKPCDYNLDVRVFSDSKWLLFIFNQIFSNSMKYADKEPLELELYAEEGSEQVCLRIRDNGMGISPADLGRVFEKGFTGSNGRENHMGYRKNQATGIGLYLCRELCRKLGHGISIESREGIGTEVCITFPKGSMMRVVE